MFDEKRVAQIAKQGKAESWPYPKIFSALKEAGVTSQEVGVENFRSIYKNGDQEWIEPIPDDFSTLQSAEKCDKTSVEQALLRRINHETSYVEFLGAIAAAGVVSYKVDMSTHTVTYRDRNEQGFYVQNVPDYREEK